MEQSPPQITEKAHAELLVLYEHTIEDIERAKQWQWSFTYHPVIAQGGLLALYTLYGDTLTSGWVRWVFTAISVGIAVFGSFGLQRAEHSLAESRERVKRCRLLFDQPFHTAFGQPTPKTRFPMVLVVWVSALLVSLLFHFK